MKVYSNNLYHIYNRGHDKNLIFFEEDNYRYFLQQFKKYAAPHCEVFAYCLMPNHFHFFVYVENEQLFEKGMKNFLISYAKAINKKYNKVGSLFQGRYKASEITTKSYYTIIIAYIHQNPVKAGLVEKPEDYKFSSYNAYLSQKESLVHRTDVLDWFGGLEHFIEYHKLVLDEYKLDKMLKL